MHRDGYGFVIPDSEEVAPAAERRHLHRPAEDTDNAMHGDRVLVEMHGRRGDGRAEGQIVRVSSGARTPPSSAPSTTGRAYNYVTPMDEKITLDIVIPRGAEIPGKISHRGHERKAKGKKERGTACWAQEARSARRRAEDLEGVVVDVEITDWPGPTRTRGARDRDSGPPGRFRRGRRDRDPQASPAAPISARGAGGGAGIPNMIPARELRGRRDFRGLPIVTIDGETARDFDDAVFVHACTTEISRCRCTSPTWPLCAPRPRRSMRRRGCAAPRFISPTAPCPCCRSSSPPTSARCARDAGPAGDVLRDGNRRQGRHRGLRNAVRA